MNLWNKIDGHILGVPVTGLWTGRGIKVTEITDGQPLDSWLGLSERVHHGRIAGRTAIEVGGEYLMDEAYFTSTGEQS